MVLEKSDTTLLMEQLVVSSDDDLEIWAGITVGRQQPEQGNPRRA